MGITLLLHLPGGELPFMEYTTMDISRRDSDFHINTTNDKQDLAFNAFFDQIQGLLEGKKTFSITIQAEKAQAAFDGMAVDYHLNTGIEVLHFGKPIEQTEENVEQ